VTRRTSVAARSSELHACRTAQLDGFSLAIVDDFGRLKNSLSGNAKFPWEKVSRSAHSRLRVGMRGMTRSSVAFPFHGVHESRQPP
jgi:hypothetical protein